MRFLLIIPGLMLFFIGLGYLYRPDLISAFNSWCRENLFSDRLLIIKRKKIGILLLFASLLVFSLFII